jgi:transcriptional regulator with XRE-family HTH domain
MSQPVGPSTPKLGLSIAEFCEAVGISQAYYFELKRGSRAPREMALGTRRIISIDEARRWCAELTATTTKDLRESADA